MATIRKRGTKWQVQVRRKSGFAKSASFTARKDAERWAVETEREAERFDAGLAVTPKLDEPLSVLIERYRETILPLKRSSYQEGYILNALAGECFARLPVSQIKPEIIAQYRDRRLNEVTPSTLIRSLGVLAHVMETARREWGYDWLANPVRLIRKPKPNAARSRRLKAGEETRLLAALAQSKNPHLLPLAKFALESAMRMSEMLGLEWERIDLAGRIAYLPLTKNGRSRHVPLTPVAVEILSTLRSEGLEKPFPATPSAIKQAWGHAVRRARIDDLHFHDLRHEAISRLFERGLSLPEVGLISGHSDPRQLLRYTHVQAQKIVSKLSRADEGIGVGLG